MKWKNGIAILSVMLLSGVFTNVYSTPAQIIIIRHGEKPATGPELNAQGRARAQALVEYFVGKPRLLQPELLQKGPIVAVYANPPRSNKPEDSKRPVETCEPTAKALGLTVNTHYIREKIPRPDRKASHKKNRSQFQMAQELLTNPAYDNKTVLICWEHITIPDLSAALGAQIGRWGNHFDKTLLLTYQNGVATPHFFKQPPLDVAQQKFK